MFAKMELEHNDCKHSHTDAHTIQYKGPTRKLIGLMIKKNKNKLYTSYSANLDSPSIDLWADFLSAPWICSDHIIYRGLVKAQLVSH